MAGYFVLAHDLGTTGNKASLYDGQGKICASAFHGYATEYPSVNWAEQNPEDWWSAVCRSTQQLLASARVQPRDIACIVFSGQMMGAVAVDRAGRPLRKAIIWADMRAVDEGRWMTKRVGAEMVYRLTGHRAGASYSGAKILWVRAHEPEVFARVHKFLQAKDFIVARLTGQFVTDYSDASGTNLYDLRAKQWSAQILEAVELDHALLPELHSSTDVVGHVGRDVADEAGLAPGTPVVMGGGDGSCAAVGAGVVREGSAYNYLGASSWIGLATREPILDATMRTFTFAHLVPDMFSPTGTMQAAGASYQWLRDTLCPQEQQAAAQLKLSAYEMMNLLAEQSPPGANGLVYLPYLMGERSPRWNLNARGAFVGLTVQHTRADIIRATLEGITFNLKVILEAFEDQGAHVEAMRVIGGGARSRLWRQIMADIYGKPVMRPALLEEATSLGAALAGGIGVELFKDFSLAEELTPIVDTTLPNPTVQPVYDRLYQVFNQAYAAMVPVYEALADARASDR